MDKYKLIDWFANSVPDKSDSWSYDSHFADFFSKTKDTIYQNDDFPKILEINLSNIPKNVKMTFEIAAISYKDVSIQFNVIAQKGDFVISKALEKMHSEKAKSQMNNLQNLLVKYNDEKKLFNLNNTIRGNQSIKEIVKYLKNFLKNETDSNNKLLFTNDLIMNLTFKLSNSKNNLDDKIDKIMDFNNYFLKFDIYLGKFFISTSTLYFENIKWSEPISLEIAEKEQQIFENVKTGATKDSKLFSKDLIVLKNFKNNKIEDMIDFFEKYSKIKLEGLNFENTGQGSNVNYEWNQEFDFKIDLLNTWHELKSEDFYYVAYRQKYSLRFNYHFTEENDLVLGFILETFSAFNFVGMNTNLKIKKVSLTS